MTLLEEAPAGAEALDFGVLSVPDRPGGAAEARTKFRIAVLGDFSGRANRGALEVGADLGKRKPLKLDVDTVDDVIARFRTELVLPIGPEGAAVAVELGSLDDLHPDELYDAVEVFQELQNLRRLLKSGQADRARADLEAWGARYGALGGLARRRARGAQVPADLKLSEFAQLIGARAEAQPEPTATEELIRRVVAPYVVKAPDPEIPGMLAAVDEALSGTMRALLHNPDFQVVESAWRSLDLLARRIETGGGLEIVVYDVAAEELAIDLAVAPDLAESGIFEMLAEKPALDQGQGAISAVMALYQFEETPPHAELLGRLAKVAAYMDAPVVTSVSAKAFDVKTDDLHPLVAGAFEELRALPEAAYLGLAVPRFLLRQPYGRRSDPIERFDFEEFTRREGLKGMLWAHPGVLVAVLLGASWTQGGGKVVPGAVMTLDDVPFTYVTDADGDQVALPCTERLLTERSAAEAARRGFMPVLAIVGRNEVRLGSFRSVQGETLAGPWAENAVGGAEAARSRVDTAVADPEPAPEPQAPEPEQDPDAELDALLASLEAEDDAPLPEPDEDDLAETEDLDALLASLDEPEPEAEDPPEADELDALLASLEAEPEPVAAAEEESDDLDALLAAFGDETEPPAEDSLDDELDALLKDL